MSFDSDITLKEYHRCTTLKEHLCIDVPEHMSIKGQIVSSIMKPIISPVVNRNVICKFRFRLAGDQVLTVNCREKYSEGQT